MAPSKSAAERLADTPHGEHRPVGEWRPENGAWLYRCTCGVELIFPGTVKPPKPEKAA